MNCEHGVSIYEDCNACNNLYTSMNQHWETKQIRRELASVDLRFVQLAREREAERRRRMKAEAKVEEAKTMLWKSSHYVGDSFKAEIERWIKEP